MGLRCRRQPFIVPLETLPDIPAVAERLRRPFDLAAYTVMIALIRDKRAQLLLQRRIGKAFLPQRRRLPSGRSPPLLCLRRRSRAAADRGSSRSVLPYSPPKPSPYLPGFHLIAILTSSSIPVKSPRKRLQKRLRIAISGRAEALSMFVDRPLYTCTPPR